MGADQKNGHGKVAAALSSCQASRGIQGHPKGYMYSGQRQRCKLYGSCMMKFFATFDVFCRFLDSRKASQDVAVLQ